MLVFEKDSKTKVIVKKANILDRMMFKISSVFVFALAFIGVASADIGTDLTNFTLIIGNSTSGLTGWTVSIIGVFMTPPLLYFVVMGIFVSIIGIVRGLLMRRGGGRRR